MDRIEKLTALLTQQPNDAFLQHALALEYIKLGDDDTARRYFENILTKDPGYVGSYYHLGKLLARQTKTPEAIAIFEEGMAQAKLAGDKHAYNELQGALEELDD